MSFYTNSLPPKQSALFKKMLKCYEQKQYNCSLKYAKKILENPSFQNNAETIAMKGLILNALGRKDEAYSNVKQALKNNINSHVCWHAYGVLQRSDNKYDEAIKCYLNAVKCNPENVQVWRDLSFLQIHKRDLEGFCVSRFQLFKLKADQQTSWIGLVMAHHLLKNYDLAIPILREFLNQNKANLENTSIRDFEYSELYLYQIMIYIESKLYEEAFNFLNEYRNVICDKVSLYEYETSLLINLKRNTEAIDVIKNKLLNRNPEYKFYYDQLEIALDVQNDEKKRHEIYIEYQNKFPSSNLPFRIPLNFITDLDDFKTLVDDYMRKSLRKCHPALFKDLKSIYIKDEKKIKVIQDLMHSYCNNLKKYSSFDDDETQIGSEDPTLIVWVNFYLAQHYNYLKNFDIAMNYIDEAILHTPTLIDLFVIKGKIYKNNNKLNEVVECLKEAQSLDQADRYLNSKCVKYLLRANLIEEAENMCSKFKKEVFNINEDLNEMQCMWYQIEAANAFYRLCNYGEALKKCHEINRHFYDIQEDQFDFHTYCIRKVTLRSYIDLLRLEDTLRNNHFFIKAANLAIEIYLKLFDNPLTEEDNLAKNSETEQNEVNKKKKIKKEKKIKKNDEECDDKVNDQKAKDPSKKDKSYKMASTVHYSPLIPSELEKPKNALEEAEKFLKPLQIYAKDKIDTHLLAFSIYYKKNKIMLMLQSLKRAAEIDSLNVKLRNQFKLFIDLVVKKDKEMNENLQKVISIEAKKLTDNYLGDINYKFEKLNLNNKLE